MRIHFVLLVNFDLNVFVGLPVLFIPGYRVFCLGIPFVDSSLYAANSVARQKFTLSQYVVEFLLLIAFS